MNLLVFLLAFIFHDFHISVYEIVYDEEESTVQITGRIFLDDLEKALRQDSGQDKLDIVADSLISHQASEQYLKKHFELTINDGSAIYKFLGGERENDVMWVYLEVVGVKEVKSILLKNDMLMDVYDDQRNMVHFKIDGNKKSFILTEEKAEATYSN